jgi:hypothetical protein
MMSDPFKENQLVSDVFSEVVTDDLRQRSLAAMVAYSRRRHRRQRIVTSVGAALVLASFISLLFVESEAPNQKVMLSPTIASALSPRLVSGTPIKVLSDEDLFALFPERSLGVVDDRGGYQLVFLGGLDDDIVVPPSDAGP